MDKSSQLFADSTATTTTNNTSTSRDQFLKHLNKLSHKISKPPIIKNPSFNPAGINQNQNFNQNQTHPQPVPSSQSQVQSHNLQAQQQQPHHQPPVYNINKNDFRDVVQKLTGSPARDRLSNPPPVHQPKPQSSRLQRIRPPPLAQVSNRPSNLLNSGGPPAQPPLNPDILIGRPVAPLSPLPPLPSVHAAAESPVSAYMRFLQNSNSTADSNSKEFSGFSPLAPLVSPRWNNLVSPQNQPQGINHPPPSSTTTQPQIQFPTPSSPLPFGFLNSPKSPYPLLSPNPLFSPSSGQLGFPLSPTVPVPSPRWKSL